jgi:hypothetical protein
MTNETIFYTQVASIVAFLVALFTVYRALVEQKDGVIQLLRDRLAEKEEKLKDLRDDSPDALVTALSSRVEVTLKELSRLKEDGDRHKHQISIKESDLQSLRSRLASLTALIEDTDLICKQCGAPLNQRTFFPIYGHVNGREVDAEGEYIEYACGLALKEGLEVSPCRNGQPTVPAGRAGR